MTLHFPGKLKYEKSCQTKKFDMNFFEKNKKYYKIKRE